MVLTGHQFEHTLDSGTHARIRAWCMVLKYKVETFYSGTKVSRGPFWHALSVSSETIHCLAFPATLTFQNGIWPCEMSGSTRCEHHNFVTIPNHH